MEGLSDTEALALLLRCTPRARNARGVAEALIEKFGGLAGLRGALGPLRLRSRFRPAHPGAHRRRRPHHRTATLRAFGHHRAYGCECFRVRRGPGEALGIHDEGQALGRLLDQLLWWEVRSEVQRLLGIEVQNGNG
ncbi:MAG: hypothetical protein O7H41_09415 [Planctomycetota bacterium]|nr:hypothetical protein [Planctomycetota bacterium]